MASPLPRVKLITIDGLFRQYDHRIPLRLDERVTVLHGRNGVGKTITLALIAALLQGDYSKLAKVPFKKLRIEFTDESFLSVSPSKKRIRERSAGKRRGSKRTADLANSDEGVFFGSNTALAAPKPSRPFCRRILR